MRFFVLSVTVNVCKNEFSTLTCARIGISRAGVDVLTRGKKSSRARRPRFATELFASRRSAICAGRCQIDVFTEAEEIANAIFCSVGDR